MRHRRGGRTIQTGLLALALLSMGCSNGGSETPDLLSTVRDSAQIVVVDNRIPAAGSRLDWRLSPRPVLTVGALDGDAAYLLYEVRAARQLPDGRLLVVNGGTSEIRVFDASGGYLSSWGREGEGPGEFAGVTDVAAWSSDILRREREPLAVSREHIDAFAREQRDRLDEEQYRRFVRRFGRSRP